jgi:hypothetical protein
MDELDEELPEVIPDAEIEVVVDADAPALPVIPAAPSESDRTQKRIDELIWKNTELKRQMDALQRPAVQPPPVKPIAPPTLAQFEYDESKFQFAQQEYLDSLVDQRVAERFSKADQQRQTQTREQTFQQRQQEFAAKSPDYVEKVIQGAERGEWACSTVMAEIIQESDNGPAVALYLASNPKIASQLSALSERAVARELGRIEAKLEKPVAPVTRISQAPPPPPKIEATNESVVKDDDALSTEQWLAAERKRMAQRGR